MDERIRKLRRMLDLTQQEFADRIGIKRNTVANYEVGRNEPVDSVISLICREFHVREEWLRTGEGEMFAPAPRSALDALVEEQGLSDAERILLEKFLALRPEVRQDLLLYIKDVAAALVASDKKAAAAAEGVAEFQRNLERQVEAGGDASTSIGSGGAGHMA